MRSMFRANNITGEEEREMQRQLERVVLESPVSKTWSSQTSSTAVAPWKASQAADNPRKSGSRRSDRPVASAGLGAGPFDAANDFDRSPAGDQWKTNTEANNIKRGCQTLFFFTLLVFARLVRDVNECRGEVKDCRVCDDDKDFYESRWFFDILFIAFSFVGTIYSYRKPGLTTYCPVVVLWYFYVFMQGRAPMHATCRDLADQWAVCYEKGGNAVLREAVESVDCTWQGSFPMMMNMAFILTSHSFLPNIQLMDINWVFIIILLLTTDREFYWSYDIIPSFLLLVICEILARIRKIHREKIDRNIQVLRQKQTKGTRKIFNIFRFMAPKHVATDLIVFPDKIIAEELPCVTVLFINIDGFDERARQMEHKDLLGYLNDHFEAWDNICKSYQVTKIETWMEEYVCAVGMAPDEKTQPPGKLEDAKDQPSHHTVVLERLIQAASSILKRQNFEKGPDELVLKMGMHTGPVYAGVVGQKLPRYRLVGDTMNTAARMMQKGERGELQFGDATRKHLPSWVSVKEPKEGGEILMKGLGNMNVYLLDRDTDELRSGDLDSLVDESTALRGRKFSVVDLFAQEDHDSITTEEASMAQGLARKGRDRTRSNFSTFARQPTSDDLTRLSTIHDLDDDSSSDGDGTRLRTYQDADDPNSTVNSERQDDPITSDTIHRRETTTTGDRPSLALRPSKVRFSVPSNSRIRQDLSRNSSSAWVRGKLSALAAARQPTERVEEDESQDFQELTRAMAKARGVDQMSCLIKVLGFGLRTSYFTDEVTSQWIYWHHHQQVCHKLYQNMEVQTTLVALLTVWDAAYFVLMADVSAVETFKHVWYSEDLEQYRFVVFLCCRCIIYLFAAMWQYGARADFRRGTPPNLWWKYGWMPVNPAVMQILLILTHCATVILFFISYSSVSNPTHIDTACSKEDILTKMQEHRRYTSVNTLLYFFTYYYLTSELQFRFRFHFIYLPLALLPSCLYWGHELGYLPWDAQPSEGGQGHEHSLDLFWARDSRWLFILTWFVNMKNAYQHEWNLRSRFKANITLNKTRMRTGEILQKMLPPRVVEEIQENPMGWQLPSHKYKRATICQSDLVGFTKLVKDQTPKVAVSWLDQIFGQFDAQADLRGIWKVETVGDAYIAGMAEDPLTVDNSPVSVVLFGEDMVRAVKEWAEKHNVDCACRVGVHFGKCTGGIVGAESQRYHLFGEFMTVLAMLEATSMPNKVQMSKVCKEEVERQIYEEGPVEGEVDLNGFEKRTEEDLVIQLSALGGELVGVSEADTELFRIPESSRMVVDLRAQIAQALHCFPHWLKFFARGETGWGEELTERHIIKDFTGIVAKQRQELKTSKNEVHEYSEVGGQTYFVNFRNAPFQTRHRTSLSAGSGKLPSKSNLVDWTADRQSFG